MEERLVVGAAIVVDGRLLAARRTAPLSAAGRWELPGGKVEAGEEPGAAVVREIAEELDCTVEVVAWLDGRVEVGGGLTLEVALVRLVGGTPQPLEHDRLTWLEPDEIRDLDWLDADRPFLAELVTLLREGWS